MIHGHDKKIGNKYYFLKYNAFIKALEQAEQDNKHKDLYKYSAGAEMLDDMKEYFYIKIHL